MKHSLDRVGILAWVSMAFCLLTAAAQPPQEEPIVALIGAEIRTMADAGTVRDGVVLMQGNNILQVGDASTEIPEGAERINVSGMIMTPGLIDARSRLWLTDAAANSSASDASLNVLDGVDGFAEDWREVIREGITTVYVQPARQGTAGGYGAVLSVAPGENGPEVIAERAALQASLGVGASNNRARSQQFDRTKKLFAAAEEYQKKWDEYNDYLMKKAENEGDDDKNEAAKETDKSAAAAGGQVPGRRPVRGRGGPVGDMPGGNGSGKGGPGRGTGSRPADGLGQRPASGGSDADKAKSDSGQGAKKADEEKKEEAPKKPAMDLQKEQLAKVVRGELPLRLEIHTADDAHYALQLAKEFKDLQLVLDGLSQLKSNASSVVELAVPVVLGPWLESEPLFDQELDADSSWGETFESYSGTLALATFGSQASSSRLLRAHVGRAIANGIDAERALQAVTIQAAKLLGLSDRLGTIEAGKRADLVCFTGDPADASARAALVVSAGRIIHRHPELVPTVAEGIVTDFDIARLPERYAIRSRNVLTPTGTVEPRLIVVDAGKIASLAAADVELEEGLPVIDVGQAVVTPGLFSAHATFGIEEFIDPASQSDSAYVVAGDVFGGIAKAERKRVGNGLLRALLAPGDSNPIAGTASLVRLGTGGDVQQRLAASKFVLTSRARSPERYPSSLAGQLQLVKQSLNGSLLASRVYLPKPVIERIAARSSDTFQSIQSGDRLVLIAAETDAEIRAALDLIDRQHLQAVLVGPKQLTPFIDRIKSLGIKVIARPVSISDYNWYADDLAKAHRAGIPINFAGETAEQLRLTAAVTVSAGMDRNAALAALCNGPTDLLDAPGFSPGEPADLVIWSASPIHLAAQPLLVIVDGKAVKHEE